MFYKYCETFTSGGGSVDIRFLEPHQQYQTKDTCNNKNNNNNNKTCSNGILKGWVNLQNKINGIGKDADLDMFCDCWLTTMQKNIILVLFEWSLDLYLPYKGKTLLVAITLSHRLN